MTGIGVGPAAEQRASRPATVWLLVGLTGSGKTTFAKRLEVDGVVRLSLDELVFARHGRYGVDYHESEYFAKEAPIVEEVYARLGELVAAGRDVVLDVGLWRRADRDAAKKLVESAGGVWRLIFFKVAREELLRRLRDAAWFGQAECGEGLLDGRGQLGALAEGPGGAGEGAQMQALEFVA